MYSIRPPEGRSPCPPLFPASSSSKHAPAAALDRLNLDQLDGPPPEPRRQLAHVEELAARRRDGAQAGAARAADAAPPAGLVARGQGAVLRRALAVLGEAGGERGGFGGRVGLGGVVEAFGMLVWCT